MLHTEYELYGQILLSNRRMGILSEVWVGHSSYHRNSARYGFPCNIPQRTPINSQARLVTSLYWEQEWTVVQLVRPVKRCGEGIGGVKVSKRRYDHHAGIAGYRIWGYRARDVLHHLYRAVRVQLQTLRERAVQNFTCKKQLIGVTSPRKIRLSMSANCSHLQRGLVLYHCSCAACIHRAKR